MESNELSKLNLGFSTEKNPEISENPSEDLSLGIGKEKVEALKKSISEIKEMVLGRNKLSRQIFQEGEKIKTEINNYLIENEGVGVGTDSRDLIKEKNDLRSKKVGVSELQLNEKIGAWKDIALLKKELREYERELIEREERLNMITKILGDEK
jgi:hypothetical protein